MVDYRANTEDAGEGGAVDTRREWDTPTVSRISAGAAEVGYEANISDGNFSQS